MVSVVRLPADNSDGSQEILGHVIRFCTFRLKAEILFNSKMMYELQINAGELNHSLDFFNTPPEVEKSFCSEVSFKLMNFTGTSNRPP